MEGTEMNNGTEMNKGILSQVKKNREELSLQQIVDLYGGGKIKIENDIRVFDPNFPEEKTEEYVERFFGLGSDFSKAEEWMDCFSDDILYVVADQTCNYGLENVKKHLRSELKKSPPLTYTFFDVSIKGNMSVVIFGNNMNNGNSFLLCGINFFNSDGKAFVNIDLYNRFKASLEVIHDLITHPKDALTVFGRFV